MKTKKELELQKKRYEEKIKKIDEIIDKMKPNQIGFQYQNKNK